MRIEHVNQLSKVGQRAGQAVYLVDDHDLDLAGVNVDEEALQRGALQRATGMTTIVVVCHQRPPALMLLTLDVGLASLALSVERVELLLQAFLRGFARVDRAPAE